MLSFSGTGVLPAILVMPIAVGRTGNDPEVLLETDDDALQLSFCISRKIVPWLDEPPGIIVAA